MFSSTPCRLGSEVKAIGEAPRQSGRPYSPFGFGHVITDPSKLERRGIDVQNGIGGAWIPVSGLSDASRIDYPASTLEIDRIHRYRPGSLDERLVRRHLTE